MPVKNDKRTRILKAAVKVFAKRGFYQAKVTEIAKAAGVADGTIYLYFKSKDEILISIFDEEMEKFIGKIKAEVAGDANGLEKVRTFVRSHLSFVRQNPRLAQVFQVELRQSNKFIKEYSGSKLKEYLGLVAGYIEQGQQEGMIRPDVHAGLLKRVLFGALDEVATHWVLMKNGKYDLDESAEQIAEIFLRGVAVARN